MFQKHILQQTLNKSKVHLILPKRGFANVMQREEQLTTQASSSEVMGEKRPRPLEQWIPVKKEKHTKLANGGSFAQKYQHQKGAKSKLSKREKAAEWPLSEHVLAVDIQTVIQTQDIQRVISDQDSQLGSEVDVKILEQASTGEGLGISAQGSTGEVFVVPFCTPGDVVKARPYKRVDTGLDAPHVLADFLQVLEPSPNRQDSLIKCQYFGRCAGCQFQMLSHTKQLEQKRKVVSKALHNFSLLPSDLIPLVKETYPSPLQYNFRTKLTPHHNGRSKRQIERDELDFNIGFNMAGQQRTMDIEDCPLGSKVLNMGMKRERAIALANRGRVQRGATILLRESTQRLLPTEVPAGTIVPSVDESRAIAYEEVGDWVLKKSCITEPKAISTEYIDNFQLKSPANSFFQNNNSILPGFLEYIRQQISDHHFTSLIDAYCGSGLFSVTLGNLFERTIGIDIDSAAVEAAKKNAEINANLLLGHTESPLLRQPSGESKPEGIASRNGVHFIAADAKELFLSVKGLNPEETVVIIDPPRKGCDTVFLQQLLELGPKRIIYVSCNVHSQARDIGWLLRRGKSPDDAKIDAETASYKIDSVGGFEFFPQTTHVEGVAVLTRNYSL